MSDGGKAEMDAHEKRRLRKMQCPWSGLPLTVSGNVQIPDGTLSCGVCDCFGYSPEEVASAQR